MLATGLIDEKIFQRQLYKGGLTGVLGACSGGVSHPTSRDTKQQKGRGFSKEELRKLFSMNEDTDCDTRDALAAVDDGSARPWTDARTSLHDPVLQAAVHGSSISFAWLEGARGGGADAMMSSPGCKNPTALAADNGTDSAIDVVDTWTEGRPEAVSDSNSSGSRCCDDEVQEDGGSEAIGHLAEAMGLLDSDADDAAAAHGKDLVLDSD